MEHKNLAYDLSLFEARPKERQKNNIIELPKEKLEQNRRRRTRPALVVVALFFTLMITSVVGVMIQNQVELNELTAEINAATKELEESESVYTQLQMRAESKMSLKAVEEYAHDKLGMRELEQYQIQYISLSEGDKAEVNETQENKSWGQIISDSISGLLS